MPCLWCYVCLVLLRFRLYAFIEAAALRSIVLRYAGAPIATRVSFFFSFFFLVGDVTLFEYFCAIIMVFSLYGEYVVRFFLRMVFFYPVVSTGWNSNIISLLCKNSITKQTYAFSQAHRKNQRLSISSLLPSYTKISCCLLSSLNKKLPLKFIEITHSSQAHRKNQRPLRVGLLGPFYTLNRRFHIVESLLSTMWKVWKIIPDLLCQLVEVNTWRKEPPRDILNTFLGMFEPSGLIMNATDKTLHNKKAASRCQ